MQKFRDLVDRFSIRLFLKSIHSIWSIFEEATIRLYFGEKINTPGFGALRG